MFRCLIEVVEVVAPIHGAVALLVLPDISLPEAGLAVLHVPLMVGHRHGSVVSIIAPEKFFILNASSLLPTC